MEDGHTWSQFLYSWGQATALLAKQEKEIIVPFQAIFHYEVTLVRGLQAREAKILVI